MLTIANAPLFSQKEDARHGEAAFPIELYRTNLHETYQDVPLHWHEEAELTLVLRGKSTYTIQLESIEVEAGDIVFVPPQQLHAVTTGGGEMDSDTFVFHMKLLGIGNGDACAVRYLVPVHQQKLRPPTVLHPDHPCYDRALRVFRELDRVWKAQEPGYELAVKANLLLFLAMLMPHSEKSTADLALRTEHAEKIKTALEFMDRNYGEEISIADVAAACYFSQYHFMRFFKKYMGVSCGEYLKNLRLEKSARAFSEGRTNILDVAGESGFRNLSYFYREFQKKFGCTPKQFIQKCQGA